MPATMYGPDLGEVYRTSAAVKGQRLQNRLAEHKLGQIEGAADNQNKLMGLRQAAAGGGIDAERALLIQDPEGGAKFLEAASKANGRQREKMKQSVDEIGKMSAFVLQGKDDSEKESRWQMVRSSMPDESQSKMPENYNQAWVENSLARASSMDKILENPKVSQVGGEDRVYKDGRLIESKARPVKEGDKGGGLKTADESLLYRMSAKMYGGIFNEAGELIDLDPEVADKVQAISALSAELFMNKKAKTRSGAVKMAKKQIEGGGKPGKKLDPKDPNNIRNLILK